MGSPFVGELRLVGFNFAPVNWAQCQGQQMAISDNPALFNLIGTTYGGNGQTTFALPNLAGRVSVHMGTGSSGTPYLIGQQGGTETVTLSVNQYPQHSHAAAVAASPQSSYTSPSGNIPCGGQEVYGTLPPTDPMASGMVAPSNGGNLPHNNLQPFLVLNWIISLAGIYPTQS
jgi:microcystin-dependent protein